MAARILGPQQLVLPRLSRAARLASSRRPASSPHWSRQMALLQIERERCASGPRWPRSTPRLERSVARGVTFLTSSAVTKDERRQSPSLSVGMSVAPSALVMFVFQVNFSVFPAS